MLDNAIEATAKETAHKVIKIKLLNKNDTVIISISNRISKPVKIVNGMIQTSKSDKENHGIGLNNIMTIVKSMMAMRECDIRMDGFIIRLYYNEKTEGG